MTCLESVFEAEFESAFVQLDSGFLLVCSFYYSYFLICQLQKEK